jgi:hypothetical protein
MRAAPVAIVIAVLSALAVATRPATAAEFAGPLETAVYGWLELLDAGRFDDAWQNADPLLREGVSQAEWTTATRKVRDGFGAIASRHVASKDYHRQIEGGPDGNYFTLRIDTSFGDGRRVVEVVTLTAGSGGTYRTVAYGIKR